MSPNDHGSLWANLGFAVLLYLALRLEIGLLTVVAIGFVWVMLGLYLVALGSPRRGSHPPLRPAWFFLTTDVAVLGILIGYGWYATAGAWIASSVVQEMMCGPLIARGRGGDGVG